MLAGDLSYVYVYFMVTRIFIIWVFQNVFLFMRSIKLTDEDS